MPAKCAAAEVEAKVALAKCDVIAEAILQTPARTLAGVLVKLRLRQHFYFEGGEGYGELLGSVTSDLQRMLDRPATASGRREALRYS